MRCRRTVFLIGIGMIAALVACGNPQNFQTFTLPPISSQPTSLLFVITPPAALAINATTALSAAVTNFSSNALIVWSAKCDSAGACGSFSVSQTTSGGTTNYIAPSVIPSGATVTITATLVGSTSQSISASIKITPPQPITISLLGVPPAFLQVNATVPLRTQITNDVSANPQVKWTVACASAACGTFNPTATSSEGATNYTAPSTIPSGNSVTVTATSITDPTKSASANITIIQAASTLANGTYVFQLSGPVGPAVNFVSGVIVAHDGAITGGEQDYINYAFDQNAGQYAPVQALITGGSYTTTPDGNLQITLSTNDGRVGVAGVETIDGVIITNSVTNSRVLLTELNGSIGSGTLDLQTSPAAPSGGYAFTIFGVDSNGQPAGIGGILDINQSEIVPASSVLDINDDFMFSPTQPLAATAVTGPDQFGRVQFQLTPGTTSAFQSINLDGYIVDAAHIRLIEIGGDQFQGVMGGTALGQTTSPGTFAPGTSYVFGAAGEEKNGGSLQVVGVFTANSSGGLTGTLNWNDLTEATTQSPINFNTASYTVDPTGRVTLSSLTDGSTFNYQFELYLTGSGEGLLLSSSTAEMIAGRAFEQQAGPFALGGSYGLSATEVGSSLGTLGAETSVGPILVAAGTGTDTLTGFVDFGNAAADVPVTGSVTTTSTGIFTGTLAGLDAGTYATPNNFAFYLVDNTQALMIETDNAQLTLGYLLQLQ
ncbi:MAG TPA: hypothetical protein VFF64_08150 [Candidatus Eremiobacteraceae bacterium]|nr:hypothetical protein [Candidatus Eremiobacteraceae bacterium]